jgi:hypothetical protein
MGFEVARLLATLEQRAATVWADRAARRRSRRPLGRLTLQGEIFEQACPHTVPMLVERGFDLSKGGERTLMPLVAHAGQNLDTPGSPGQVQ